MCRSLKPIGRKALASTTSIYLTHTHTHSSFLKCKYDCCESVCLLPDLDPSSFSWSRWEKPVRVYIIPSSTPLPPLLTINPLPSIHSCVCILTALQALLHYWTLTYFLIGSLKNLQFKHFHKGKTHTHKHTHKGDAIWWIFLFWDWLKGSKKKKKKSIKTLFALRSTGVAMRLWGGGSALKSEMLRDGTPRPHITHFTPVTKQRWQQRGLECCV